MLPLPTVMTINALTSGATGLLMIFFSKPIANLFGTSNTTPFIVIGIGLVLFAAYVLYVKSQLPNNTKGVKSVILLDWAWVICSFVALIPLASKISIMGIIAIIAVALWVGLMAVLQKKGLATYQKV